METSAEYLAQGLQSGLLLRGQLGLLLHLVPSWEGGREANLLGDFAQVTSPS